MLGFGVNPTANRSPSWKKWIKLITQGGAIMELKKAAIIPDVGSKLIRSKGFNLTNEEVMAINQCFHSDQPPETIRASGCTYCLKSACPEQVVAFNGGRYLIASKTKSSIIVAVCESKAKLSAASTWLLRIASSIS
ncbi:uncharacterized protein LOC124148666 [Haliotis rufescens]|uniref:uncharacterized protein LOC124148666 n=1 Tax=Haliotis rufescens TaxID=6454 RepID=UPI001EB0A96C|nr:uncharacterized protein LOC124148666 [Haliotis rufescens]